LAEGEEIFKIPSEEITRVSYLEQKFILTDIIHKFDKLNLSLVQSMKFTDSLSNLFHELGHILLHGKKDVYVDFCEDGEKTIEEQQADDFAQKWLIPDFKAINERIANSVVWKDALVEIAKEISISPAIIAGRLTHEYCTDKKVYPLMSPFLKERISYTNLELSRPGVVEF
jgi:hypothetical protein